MDEYGDVARWPDGVPVHDRLIFVWLGCGHYRWSRGWRGEEGLAYCCDVCKRMTTMVMIRERVGDEPPGPTQWRWAAPPVLVLDSDEPREVHKDSAAANPSSGLPPVWQFPSRYSLPAMDPADQIRWGLEYLRKRGYTERDGWLPRPPGDIEQRGLEIITAFEGYSSGEAFDGEGFGGDWGPPFEPVRVGSLAEFERTFGRQPSIFDEYAAFKRPPWWARAITWAITAWMAVRR